MFLHVDPSNGLAIYEQVVRQIKFAVARSTLKPGQLIPSVRDVARDLAINPNTVARAYQQLQNEGVLVSVRGMGLEVAEGAAARCRQERKKLLKERLRQVLSEALQSGLECDELRQLVDQEFEYVLRKGT
jgi:GntR family transcriptional regulator